MNPLSTSPTFTKACAISLALLGTVTCGFSEESRPEARAKVQLRPKVPIHQRMDFLIDRGKLLMIPKKSLIVVPEGLKAKMYQGGELKGKVVSLSEFLAANGSWFMTYPVTFEQMMGKEKVSQEELERLRQLNRVVLATNGGSATGVVPESLEPEKDLENRKGE